MSNRAYLVASPWRRTDPGNAPAFDPEKHTIATAVARIPLLWLSLFSPADLVDGAPVASVKTALSRLDQAAGLLAKRFSSRGSLTEHASALATAIATAKAKYVTIELEEFADLFSRRSTFDARLRKALSGDAAAMTELAALEARKPFPALGQIKRTDVDVMHSLLGTSHIRAVPWEANAAPKKVRKPKVNPGAALRDALENGDVATARELLRQGADPSFSDAFGSTFEQVFYGHVPLSMLDELLKAGAKINEKQRIHGYPLIQAARVGKPEMIRALLSRGADIHVVNPFNDTALSIAVFEGHVEAVKELVKHPFTEKEIAKAIRDASKKVNDKRVAQALKLVEAKRSA